MWVKVSSHDLSVCSPCEFLHRDCRLPEVLLAVILEYEPCLIRADLESISLKGFPNAVLHTTRCKSQLFVRRGRHHSNWCTVTSGGMVDRASKIPRDVRRETAVAYHARPTKPLVVFQDTMYHAQLHGNVLTLIRVSDGAEWTVVQGHTSAEVRLCRVAGTYQFRVAKVRNGCLQIETMIIPADDETMTIPADDAELVLDPSMMFHMQLPDPPSGRSSWHVFGVAALPALTLVHVSTSGRESLLVAQVGLKSPERADVVLPAFKLSSTESVLGVSNLGDQHVVVGLHRVGSEELFRINCQSA
jgi:hypothetical protein